MKINFFCICHLALICFLFLGLSAPVSAQEEGQAISLEQAITGAAQQLVGGLQPGSTIAFDDDNIRFDAPTPELSTHIIDRLINELGTYVGIIDRREKSLQQHQQEIDRSDRGDDAENTQRGARGAGVSAFIDGSISQVGNYYLLVVRLSITETNYLRTFNGRVMANDPDLYFLIHREQRKYFWFSLGARAGGSLHLWTLSSDIIGDADGPSFSFEPAIQAAVHFTNFIALQAEAALSMDKVSYSGEDPEAGAYTASFDSFSLRVPVLVRATLFPEKLKLVSLSAIAGVSFNVSPGAMRLQSSIFDDSSYRFSMPISYVIGINPGVRLGQLFKDSPKKWVQQGVVFIDIRYYGDIAKTVIHDSTGTLALYTRNTVSFSAGYEYRF